MRINELSSLSYFRIAKILLKKKKYLSHLSYFGPCIVIIKIFFSLISYFGNDIALLPQYKFMGK